MASFDLSVKVGVAVASVTVATGVDVARLPTVPQDVAKTAKAKDRGRIMDLDFEAISRSFRLDSVA